MKKQHLLILALIISLMFGVYNFFSLKNQEKAANESFIYNLEQAQASFGVDYSKMEEHSKNEYFTNASSNLHTALGLLRFTSYGGVENNNQELVNALYNLSSCMIEPTPRWKAVNEKSELIYKYLHYIIINPNDKNNCQALSKLANNLVLNVENAVLNYEGKSPNWTVDYKIEGTKYAHDTYYTFKYTGEDGSKVKKVKYSIDTNNEGEEDKFEMEDNMVHTGKLKLTAGFPKPTDRDMIVKLEWNGKKESLTLKELLK